MHAAAYAFNPYAVPMAFSGAAILAIGSFVAIRRGFDRLGVSFLLVCLAPSLWLFGFTGAYLAVTPRTAYLWDKYVSLLGVMWIPSTSYLFASTLRGRKGPLSKGPALACAASALFSCMLLADTSWMLQGMRHYFFGYYSSYGPGMKYFLLCFSAMMAACLSELYGMYRESTSGLERRQALWVLTGFSIASFGSGDYLPGYGIEFYPFGYIFILAFVAVFAYALEVYELMDVRTAFLQTARFALAWAPFAVPVLSAVHLARAYLRLDAVPGGFELALAATCVFGAAYWRLAGRRLLRTFSRRTTARRRAFEELEKTFRYASGLREVVDATLGTVCALFDLYHMSYWQVESGGGSARLVAVKNLQPPETLDLPAALLMRLSAVEEIQESRDLPRDTETRHCLAKLQAALILPVKKGEDLIGFFVLGPKRDLSAFKSQELDLLNDFRRQLGAALTRAVLADQVHEMASQVMLAEQRAREVEKIKAVFLQAVSHELRTPLFAISGYAEVLLGTQAAGMETKFIRTIHNASQRIAALVADMIRAASLERESLELHASWFEFGAAAQRVLDAFRSKIGLIRFSLETGHNAPPVYADRDKIEDVLFRLISNAVKFSPPEAVVQVWGRHTAEGFEFGVADQGPGLSDEAKKRVFEKFNRPYDGSDEVNLRNPGSGLGLYISKTLVEMHRGRIAIQPSARGCRIVVTLPQPRPPVKQPAPPPQ